MLKGHVFEEQIFGNQIFALFINTFLNGKNGIKNGYKNSMAVTYSGNTLTVQSGVVCIQGRFLEEDTSTSVVAGTDTAYCKLVLEIDLDKQNTENEFNQAIYKIVKDTTAYPNLTQNDIANNNSGVYQYELARFRTSTNGILDFQDMRTFLDFDSIYEEIRQHIQDIDDESIFILKENINIITAYLNQSLQYVEDNTKIQLDGEMKVGNKLRLENNDIVIGSGVNNVKVSGEIFFQDFEHGAGYLFPRILKNGNAVAASIQPKGLQGAAGFQSQSFTTFVLPVQEGDRISLSSGDINRSHAQVRGYFSYILNTYLTVEVIN